MAETTLQSIDYAQPYPHGGEAGNAGMCPHCLRLGVDKLALVCDLCGKDANEKPVRPETPAVPEGWQWDGERWQPAA